MSDKALTPDLPIGATVRHRRPVKDKSIELAEQMARRGASESLVRAIGGDEAVAKMVDVEEDSDVDERSPA